MRSFGFCLLGGPPPLVDAVELLSELVEPAEGDDKAPLELIDNELRFC